MVASSRSPSNDFEVAIGSAALAAVSGAQAADAIVAAAPEPMEYVKVCDAFGKGYFLIPGTETCLNVPGTVRRKLNLSKNPTGVTAHWTSRKGNTFGRMWCVTEVRAIMSAH